MARRPKNRRKRETTLALIDRLLFETVPINFNGTIKRIPAAEAIILQLTKQQIAGKKRAARVLLKYQALAKPDPASHFELSFVEDEYTRSLAQAWEGANE